MTRYGTTASMNGHFDALPGDMFGASPFSIHRRRKRGDALARFTTKAVLLSPLFVLTVWSLIVMFSGTKKLNQMPNTSRGMKLPGWPRHPQSVKLPVKPVKKGSKSQLLGQEPSMNVQQQQDQTLVVQPPNLGIEQQQRDPEPLMQENMQQRQSLMSSVEHARQRGASVPKSGDFQPLVLGTILDHEGKMIPVYAPLGSAQSEQATSLQETHIKGSILDHEGKILPVNAPLGSAQSEKATSFQETHIKGSIMDHEGKILPIYAPLGSAEPGEVRGFKESPIESMDPRIAKSNALSTEQVQSKIILNSHAMGSTTTDVIVKPRQVPKAKSTKILYYDPSSAYVDGKLYMPQIVYDEDGNEVDLAELQAQTGAEVYLEPPETQAVSPNLQLKHKSPQKQMSRQDLERLASEPPAQDQYIIIATVAVMALMVGALSARRLRSRNFLSSCIENESLEDEIAYDVATTNGDYSTFAGNWRGADLEKFDV